MASQQINEILRLLTTTCKFSLSESIPIAASLTSHGLVTKEKIGQQSVEELSKVCPMLDQSRLARLKTATAPASKRKRSLPSQSRPGSKSETLLSRLPKRGRKFTIDAKTAPTSDADLVVPELLNQDDDDNGCGPVTIQINRAPVMMLVTYCTLKHKFPNYGPASWLSLASCTAAIASRRKGKAIGIFKPPRLQSSKVEIQNVQDYEDDEEKLLYPAGYRKLRTLGTIDIPILRKGEGEGYWGLDIDYLLANQKNVEQVKWIHPASVFDYLHRSFGDHLAIMHGAIELVMRSWEQQQQQQQDDCEVDWSTKAWQLYVTIRPDVHTGGQGWAQKASFCNADILKKIVINETVNSK
ncbi:hypothetical protein V1514DRAFT_335020 [Lipomyces japonicus]|uniref:uncharacterized protein n=1 Tax=Lipomyces japonicus TaxID=56871 RepID=UPI0034CE8ADE